MPVETDLKRAYKLLYDDKEPEKALELYNVILRESPNNIIAMVYKAASLEKLYFGIEKFHTSDVLREAEDNLIAARTLAQNRGDRSKIAMTYFRLFVHYFNRKDYSQAGKHLQSAKDHDYTDDTLSIWEERLATKLKKQTKKQSKKDDLADQMNEVQLEDNSKTSDDILEMPCDSVKEPIHCKRIDWYQTSNDVVLSIFTDHTPAPIDQLVWEIKDEHLFSLSYPVLDHDNELEFEIRLAHKVLKDVKSIRPFSRKIEIVFNKLEKNIQWRNLEFTENQSTPFSKAPSSTAPNITGNIANKEKTGLSYPSSSKNKINWDKIDLDGDNTENNEEASADEFFQKLYHGADEDTRRAMMKSFVESNGTSLNTSWDDVKDKTTETAPPEGTELKHY